MSHRVNYRRFLSIFLILAAAVAFALSALNMGVRASADGARKTVALALSDPTLRNLGGASGKDQASTLAEFRAAGMSAVLFDHETVADWRSTGRIYLYTGWQFIDAARSLGIEHPVVLRLQSEGRLKPQARYVLAGREEDLETIRQAVIKDLPGVRPVLHSEDGASPVLELEAEGAAVDGAVVGLPLEAMAEAREAGLDLFFLIRRPGDLPPADLFPLYEQLQKSGVSLILLEGNRLPRHPEAALDALDRSGLSTGFFEFRSSEGWEEFGGRAPERVVSVYLPSWPPGPQEYFLAAKDRSVGALIVYPLPGKGKDFYEGNLSLVRGIRELLKAGGLETGPPPARNPFIWPPVLHLLVGGGGLAAAALIAARIYPSGSRGVLGAGAAGILAWAPLLWVLKTEARLGLALVLAVLFPVLAVLAALEMIRVSTGFAGDRNRGAGLVFAGNPRKAPGQSLSGVSGVRGAGFAAGPAAGWILLAATGISVLGGLIIQGLLGDSLFQAKILVFRGVKASLFGPFLLLAAALALEGIAGRGRGAGGTDPSPPAASGREASRRKGDSDAAPRNSLRDFLSRPRFNPAQAAGLLILLGAAFVWWNRAGNASVIPIPDWELTLRYRLEEILGARPRIKEFLIGHPALVLLAGTVLSRRAALNRDKALNRSAAPNRRSGPAEAAVSLSMAGILAALVGQISVVNSFTHLHSPVLITLARTAWGLLFGFLGGWAALAVWLRITGRAARKEAAG